MDIASSKKGVKKSTLTEASTENEKTGVWVLKKFLVIPVPPNTLGYVTHEITSVITQ
jgi:hypothetical protein